MFSSHLGLRVGIFTHLPLMRSDTVANLELIFDIELV